MGLNKYSIKLFIFLVVLAASGFGFFWSLNFSQLVITKVIFALIFIAIFLWLLRYLNKTNQDLNQFLESIKYLDSIPLEKSSDLSFDQLKITYNSIIDQLKNAWIAKESEHLYFQLTLEHIAVGILAFNSKGKIKLSNKAARELLGKQGHNHLDDISNLDDNIQEILKNMETGSTKLFSVDKSMEELKILAKASDIKITGERLKLVSLQNIKTQLEESELVAWQKLIRVLTHEIMNSVTPIKSLTFGMQQEIQAESDSPAKGKIIKGLQAIEKRSKGLMQFVESYKNLTNVPKPSYQRIVVKNIVDNVLELMETDIKKSEINITREIVPEDLSLIADEKLISQIILNLIQNAIYALEGKKNKCIEIKASKNSINQIIISIKDNGRGIPKEIIDQIFIPFYTTRPGGSGIGLSFARQVMVMHNGSIEVTSIEGVESNFILKF